jgi:hypothetical protein
MMVTVVVVVVTPSGHRFKSINLHTSLSLTAPSKP